MGQLLLARNLWLAWVISLLVVKQAHLGKLVAPALVRPVPVLALLDLMLELLALALEPPVLRVLGWGQALPLLRLTKVFQLWTPPTCRKACWTQ